MYSRKVLEFVDGCLGLWDSQFMFEFTGCSNPDAFVMGEGGTVKL
jgi:hypothetical protein